VEAGQIDSRLWHQGRELSQHRNMREKRRAVLCLLTKLAHFVLWCVGTAGKETSKARQVRANSSRKRAP
jgi:hypothetical protein